jgi:hypothetical protein
MSDQKKENPTEPAENESARELAKMLAMVHFVVGYERCTAVVLPESKEQFVRTIMAKLPVLNRCRSRL